MFMAQTEATLRNSGNTVGQAIQSVLNVQAGLDEMKEDLAGEYALWDQKKAAFARDKDRLEKEVARLQNTVNQHNALREKKSRLMETLALQLAENRAAEKAYDQVRLRWKLDAEQAEQGIQRLELQIQRTHEMQQLSVANEVKAASKHRSKNQDQQKKIMNLTVEVRNMEDTLSNHTISAKKDQSEILAKVQQVQQEIHALQGDMVQQAQLEAQQQELGEQTARVIAMRESIKRAWSGCNDDLKKLDSRIASNKAALENANKEMVACQDLDAENQGLQERINQCRAQTRQSS